MGEIIDFETRRARKEVKNTAGEKGVIYEIYLSVVKYVNEQLREEYDNPVENLNTKTYLYLVYQGDEDRFLSSFTNLLDYWDLNHTYLHDIPSGKEFEKFNTIGDICSFIEQRVRQKEV